MNSEESLSQSNVRSTNSTEIIVELRDERKENRQQNIIIYSISVVVVLAFTLTRSFSFFQMCQRASITLHDKLFRGIIRARMFFYNENPSGRILNRFSKDIGNIDVQLPIAMMDCLVVSCAIIFLLFYYFFVSLPRPVIERSLMETFTPSRF